MRRLLSIVTSFFLVITLASASLVAGSEKGPLKTYFVAFNGSIDMNLIKSHGGELKKQYRFMPVVAVKLPEKAAVALKNNPKIEYVELDGVVNAIGQEIPWGVPHVKAMDVQQSGKTGAGIKVGIIDTGIDYTHEDLLVKDGTTFVEGTTDYMDDNNHGTHVAGTVSALNNTVGVIGVAPKVELYAIKVLDHNGDGNYSDLIAGIEWSVTNNLDIINMSLGGSTGSKSLQRAVDNAYNAGVLLIAAAGNKGFDRTGTVTYPANYDSVIAVGAIDGQNNRLSSSSVGRKLELMGPGSEIKSTIPGGYSLFNGTSMAAPHVSGVAALLWEGKAELDNVQVRHTLNDTALNLGDSFYFGNGLVDAQAAISYFQDTITTGGSGKKK